MANGRFLGMCRSAVAGASLVGAAIAFCLVAWLSKARAQAADGAPPPRPTVSRTAPAASQPEDARTDKKCATQQNCKAGVLTVTSLGPITIAEASNAGETSLELRNTGCAKLEGLLCAGEFVSTINEQRLKTRAAFQPFPHSALMPRSRLPRSPPKQPAPRPMSAKSPPSAVASVFDQGLLFTYSVGEVRVDERDSPHGDAKQGEVTPL